MSKYDFAIDLNDNTSTGMIIKKIKAGSKVLEFGCATGRLTRYLKESLNCEVYIVEIEKSAYDTAIKYAADGVCGDAMALTWAEKFKNIKFDYIVFADILEHIFQPDIVLAKSVSLLKEDGNIIVSLPNITHNDILLKAINDHFDYTKVGILDDTHIHFWGYENLQPFAERNGLFIHKMEATYCDTCRTEQYQGTIPETPVSIMNLLNERQCGEIYQFIITMGTKPVEDTKSINCIYNRNKIISNIYINNGHGFSGNNVISFESKMAMPGRYVSHYVLNDTSNVIQLRFDPIEFQSCILQHLSIRQSGKELNFTYSDHVVLNDGVYIKGIDPMVFADITPDGGAVVIDAEILIAGESFYNCLERSCSDKQSAISELKNAHNAERQTLNCEIIRLNEENTALSSEIKRLGDDKIILDEEIQKLIGTNNTKNDEITRLSESNSALNGEVTRLTEGNNTLNDEITRLSQSNNALNDEVARLNESNNALNDEIARINEGNSALNDEVTRLTKGKNALNDEIARLNEDNNELKRSNSIINNTIEQLKAEKIELNRKIASLDDEVSLLSKELNDSAENIKQLTSRAEKELNIVKSNRDKLHIDLGAYIALVNRKDEVLIAKEAEITKLCNNIEALSNDKNDLQNLYNDLENKHKELNDKYHELDNEKQELVALIEKYRNRKVVKFADKIRSILRRIKNFFRGKKS